MRSTLIALAVAITCLGSTGLRAGVWIHLCVDEFDGETTNPNVGGEDLTGCSDVAEYHSGVSSPTGRAACEGVIVTKVIDISSINFLNRVFNRVPLSNVEIKVTSSTDAGESLISTTVRLIDARVVAVRQLSENQSLTGQQSPDLEEIEMIPASIGIRHESPISGAIAETEVACPAARRS